MTDGRALLLLLLSGIELGAPQPAGRGRCAGDVCFFQESVDFDGAQKACKLVGGELLEFRSERDAAALARVLVGQQDGAWVRSTEASAEDAEADCPAAFVTTEGLAEVQWGPCHDDLGGFVCKYAAGEMCDGLQASGGVLMTYSTAAGVVLDASDKFPPGTTAVAQRSDSDFPDSKRLCFSRDWLDAPWNCEVLRGGCDHDCSASCACPEGSAVHWNRFSCVTEPRAEPQCPPGGCLCAPGYRPGADEKACVDVDECEDASLCADVGSECVNTPGGYECACSDGFDWEDGGCVNVTICRLCEHMDCRKRDGVYRCACRRGFVVSPTDPTKCTWNCTERDCAATCDPNDASQCFCQEGYVLDFANDTHFCTDIDECEVHVCDHRCQNVYGGYRCLCDDGFELRDSSECVKRKEDEEDDGGSGSEPPAPTTVPAAGLRPAPLPRYIQTGSILGITVFALLCLALLALLARNAVKRCGRFEVSALKHPDVDIYYLQQVSTETYKRLSLDRQLKNDSHRL